MPRILRKTLPKFWLCQAELAMTKSPIVWILNSDKLWRPTGYTANNFVSGLNLKWFYLKDGASWMVVFDKSNEPGQQHKHILCTFFDSWNLLRSMRAQRLRERHPCVRKPVNQFSEANMIFAQKYNFCSKMVMNLSRICRWRIYPLIGRLNRLIPPVDGSMFGSIFSTKAKEPSRFVSCLKTRTKSPFRRRYFVRNIAPVRINRVVARLLSAVWSLLSLGVRCTSKIFSAYRQAHHIYTFINKGKKTEKKNTGKKETERSENSI